MADANRIQQVMSTPLTPSMAGEDAWVRQLFGKGEDDPFTIEDVDAFEQMAKLASGGELTEQQRATFGKVRALFARRAENEKKFAEAPAQFLQGLHEQAAPLIETDPVKKAQIQARAVQELNDAKANVQVEIMGLKERLRAEPQVQIMWPYKPRPLMIRQQGGGTRSIMQPEEVRIGPLRFCYRAGQLVKVPKSVVDRLEQRQREQQDTENRRSILGVDGKIKEASAGAALWAQADKATGLTGDNPLSIQNDQVGVDPLA